jgi:hypothetical protein
MGIPWRMPIVASSVRPCKAHGKSGASSWTQAPSQTGGMLVIPIRVQSYKKGGGVEGPPSTKISFPIFYD